MSLSMPQRYTTIQKKGAIKNRLKLLVQHAERIQGSKNGYCSSLKNDSLEKKLTVLKLAAFVNHSGLYECLLKQIGQDLSDKNALQDMYTNLAGVKKLSLGRDTEKILAEKIIDEVAITATTELASRQMGMQQIDVSYDGNYIVHLAEGNIALMPTNRAAGAVRNEKFNGKLVRFGQASNCFFVVKQNNQLSKVMLGFEKINLGKAPKEAKDIAASPTGRYCFVMVDPHSPNEASLLVDSTNNENRVKIKKIKHAQFNPTNENQLLLINTSGAVKIFNLAQTLASKTPAIECSWQSDAFDWAEFVPHSNRVVLISDKQMKVAAIGAPDFIFEAAHEAKINCVAVSPSGKKVVTVADKKICVWDMQKNSLIAQMVVDTVPTSIAFNQDTENYLAVMNDSNETRLYSLLSGECKKTFSGNNFSDIFLSTTPPNYGETTAFSRKLSGRAFFKDNSLIIAKNTGNITAYDSIFLSEYIHDFSSAIFLGHVLRMDKKNKVVLNKPARKIFNKLDPKLRALIAPQIALELPAQSAGWGAGMLQFIWQKKASATG